MPLVKNPNPPPVPEAKADANPPAAPAIKKPVADDKMTKADWAAKDIRISRQGLYQAALQSPAIMQYAADLETYLKFVRQVAEDGLKFVNEA